MFRKLSAPLFAVLLSVSILSAPAVRAAPLLDVMFVLDSSGSISASEFQTQIDAAKGYVSILSTGVPGTSGPPPSPGLQAADLQAGIVQFSTNATLDLGLTGDLAAVNTALDNLNHLNGQTNHAAAFAAAAAELAANGRAGAQQAIILVTDGQANEPVISNPIVAAINAANDAKSDGILIFAIGVGSQLDQSYLDLYASNPTADFTALFGDFDSLATLDLQIAEQLLTEATVTAVDAPAPLAMLALGIAGLAFMRRRRSARA